MATRNPYLESQILTASPDRLLVMLHDGVIRHTEQASQALRHRELDSAHESLVRAQEIVAELIASLNFDAAPDFARNLIKLYHYVHRRLAEASVDHTSGPLDDALTVVRMLREAWAEASRRLAEPDDEDVSTESEPERFSRLHSSSKSDWDLNSANSSGKVWNV